MKETFHGYTKYWDSGELLHALESWWGVTGGSAPVGKSAVAMGDLEFEFPPDFWKGLARESAWDVDDGDIVFPDGSVLDDWASATLSVGNIKTDPFGLTGTMYQYTLDIAVPPSARHLAEDGCEDDETARVSASHREGKEVADMMAELRRQGWLVETTSKGHYKVTSPTGQPVFLSRGSTDPRMVKNARAMLRRHGARL